MSGISRNIDSSMESLTLRKKMVIYLFLISLIWIKRELKMQHCLMQMENRLDKRIYMESFLDSMKMQQIYPCLLTLQVKKVRLE